MHDTTALLFSKICVVIPAYNEAAAIGKVVSDLPHIVYATIVADNGSADATPDLARQAGAIVVSEPRRGYGYACLKALEYIAQYEPDTDIVVFIDGDYSDYPEDLPQIVAPIIAGEADLVIGARTQALRQKNALTPQQIIGNKLATTLMRWLYRARYTDLGPFRAIRYDKLIELQMQDKTYGWTIEMQLKALRHKLHYMEVPVRYRPRIGVSKVSGTLKGTLMAGYKILGWIVRYGL